jgi:hypothetical protein
MLVITLFAVIGGGNWVSDVFDTSIDNTAIVNGSSSDFIIDSYSSEFAIDPVLGMIATIIVIATLAVIIGIRFLGSGLSENSIRWTVIGVGYTGLWGVLSALSIPLLVEIETFGTLLYVTLTVIYVFGVLQKGIGGGGGEI